MIIQCKILYREWLGNNQLLSLDTPKGPIRMLCSSEQEIPEKIHIDWDTTKEHHFQKALFLLFFGHFIKPKLFKS